ncbi:MAG TPA: hypothetical protein VMV15_03245 [Candidatus Binataceae bacterium]|nr:hypothetical protein [Candidatus Binataceae bacterium]
MAEQETDFTPERISRLEFLNQIMQGLLIALGLGMLWMMESVRNGFFGLLDRFNLKPRGRKASAFPPGRPRRRVVKQARS